METLTKLKFILLFIFTLGSSCMFSTEKYEKIINETILNNSSNSYLIDMFYKLLQLSDILISILLLLLIILPIYKYKLFRNFLFIISHSLLFFTIIIMFKAHSNKSLDTKLFIGNDHSYTVPIFLLLILLSNIHFYITSRNDDLKTIFKENI